MVKKLFLITAAVGLIINFLSGLSMFQQRKQMIETTEWVSHSYKVIQKIDTIKLAILNAEVLKEPVPDLKLHFEELKMLVQNIPSQDILAKQVSALTNREFIAKANHSSAMELLLTMSDVESALLSARINAGLVINESSDIKVFLGSILDSLLIFLFLGFFFYERKKSAHLQLVLSKTLSQVEKTNQQMRLTLDATHAKVKTVVHDLKNPLGSIRGFAELLRDEDANKDSVREMADIIQKVSNNTLALVGTILQEAKAAETPKECVDVIQCLQEVCVYLKPLAAEKGQTINIINDEIIFSLVTSRQQIADIFFNLVGNAIKFSPYNSLIEIICENVHGKCQIKIKDEGPGFAKEDYARLFLVDSILSAKPTGRESSTGIGLYSVKRTLDTLNGEINVSNNPDRGACITLQFPNLNQIQKQSALDH